MREHDVRPLSLCILPLLLWSACASELASDADEREVGGLAEALVQPVDSITLNVTADTSILGGFNTNRNYGTQKTLALSRTLIAVDPGVLDAATPQGDYVVSAKLRLTVSPGLLLGLPRVLSAHRVLKSWTESGATWNCAIDSNVSNGSADCSGATRWSSAGGEFVSAASGSAVLPITIGQPAVVEIDVTEDVRAFKRGFPNGGGMPENYGWLLKTLIDLSLDTSSIASRESNTPPQLVMQVRRCNIDVCNDGITCSQDGFCDDQGTCFHLVAGLGSPCSDNNACTLMDGCSGMDYTCVSDTPAPVGTPCGSGLACDAQQQCVPVSPQ